MTDFNRLIRYLAYTLELLVLFMLQETPGLLPTIFGSRTLASFVIRISASSDTNVPLLFFPSGKYAVI